MTVHLMYIVKPHLAIFIDHGTLQYIHSTQGDSQYIQTQTPGDSLIHTYTIHHRTLNTYIHSTPQDSQYIHTQYTRGLSIHIYITD